MESILGPQMRRVRRRVGGFEGLTLLVSTTPYTPTHPFCAMSDAAEVRGDYRRLTIWDSGFESRADIERYIAQEAAKKNLAVADFVKTTHFRREYLSERVVDEDVVIFPEFNAKKDIIVREHPRPVGFERYVHKRVAVDLGGIRDKYGLLWGYVDFAAGLLVIEDESLMAKPNTEQLAAEMVERESRLWPNAEPTRIARVIDDDTERVIRDLWDVHKVSATKAVKQGPQGGRAASIGMIRTFIQMEALVINPRCVELRRQLLSATRNRAGNDFERTPDGHYDLCAALMYWCRGVSLTTNPYPADYSSLIGRELPAHHPLMARKEALGLNKPRGLAAAILSNNPYTSAGLNRRRR